MTTDLEQACTDLPAWLPIAAELVAEPDRGGTSPTRSKPRSRPPWNSQAANAYYDIHAEVRDTEQALRQSVTGRPAHLTVRRPGWSDGNTLRAFEAIPKLAVAADGALVDEATVMLGRLLLIVLLLPAVDVEEPWRKPDAPCPRCARKMLRYREAVGHGEVACLGCRRGAILTTGYLSGEPMLKWDDGEVTLAPPPEGTP